MAVSGKQVGAPPYITILSPKSSKIFKYGCEVPSSYADVFVLIVTQAVENDKTLLLKRWQHFFL